MAQQLQIFVSHSSRDREFSNALVNALREAEADVWYDEHNLGAGVLQREIIQELEDRPIFIVVLSKAAFASEWVRGECEWAFNLYRRRPERLLLPVVGGEYDPDDFDSLLYLESFQRIEAPGHKPYPRDDAIRRTLRLLALPSSESPQLSQTEAVAELLAQGKALAVQAKYAEAAPFFERASELDPRNFMAWFNLGIASNELNHFIVAEGAFERAANLHPGDVSTWLGKGTALTKLGKWQEALNAFDRVLALDAPNAIAWRSKGFVLARLGHYHEALAAYDRALSLDPNDAQTWRDKGVALNRMGRKSEALAAYERADALDPRDAQAWRRKASALRELGRRQEADEAEQHARGFGWQP